MPKPRITIPTSASDLIGLAESIQEQHTTLDKSSPLGLLDWETVAPAIQDATAVQTQINKLSKELEKLTERRNNLLDPLSDFVRSSRDILSGVYRSEMKKLGDFGFEVDDSPKARKSKSEAATK